MTHSGPAGAAPSGVGAGRRAAMQLREHAFRIYLMTVIGVGVLLTGLAGLQALTVEVNPWAVFLGAILCLGADRPLFDIRFGHNSTSFTWAELCVVIGLFVVPTSVMIVLAGFSVLAFHLLMRR